MSFVCGTSRVWLAVSRESKQAKSEAGVDTGKPGNGAGES